MNHVSVNVDLIGVYVIQGKNGIVMNIGVIEKNQMIGFLVKMMICSILLSVILNVI